jgi:hypothetical protein
MTTNPEELDRLIKHLRTKPQDCHEYIGGWDRIFKSDYCLAADYLELLRAELPHWHYTPDSNVEAPHERRHSRAN